MKASVYHTGSFDDIRCMELGCTRQERWFHRFRSENMSGSERARRAGWFIDFGSHDEHGNVYVVCPDHNKKEE